jgi:site-specific recombinase XerD
MRAAGDGAHGRRLRALIVILWRAGLLIQEALALAEADLDQRRGALPVRRGKGGRRREVGMDAWGWDELQPWLDLRRTAARAGVRRRFAPHQLFHAHAVARERGRAVDVIQRQLGHSNLGITSI